MAPHEQNEQRLIITSNRLPLSVKSKDDTYEAIPSSGGLVTALNGLSFHAYLWLGWPGVDINERDRESVDKALAKENASAVYLDESLAQSHYNGFSNGVLWPTLHYQSDASFDNESWDAYQRVNTIFADRISEEAADGDLIWVHDYHLLLLPRLLRERLHAQNKRCAIGFSLHTPFPADDFWRGLPVQKALLDGVLGSDLVGFHTDEYKTNFAGACRSHIGAEIEGDNIYYNDHTISIDKYVVGIDCQRFADALDDPEVQAEIQQIENQYKDKTIIIGVDRMDYTKGLPEKLQGFRVFLDQYPEWSKKVVLIQIAIPSREDVKKYQDLEGEVSKLVGQITGQYATPTSTPLIYIHRSVSFAELTALYSVSDVCLLTSRRDGMNLVASEYVACQEARHGVLVLSEFTGASAFMKGGSLLFNPSSADSLSNALYEAVTMEKEDRKKMYEELRSFVTTNTSANWTETFVGDLTKLQNR
ncbi:CAZyme family GT20 [Penicillium roqueforti]|uniref:Glycosyl transferase, family 20 n=1 Tax=Penicillium roqueforti (strain FM164) TaxID=1365484 RepID=W6Q839_PENRF|nr:tspB [Penicillium roqueforti]CDM32873.1 Glycosyl transferase, family 20 [Penicillium roqueforti FM164]KAF9238449.1 tspB [Penicillium roqueforti]KAI1830131.1 CAZyme family GT20 [Penicillium roqueforti]KAI2675668.1 CAZyme family GT20 [Penicillium roqueforti]KAI2709917.1 CAZyme family GT20 [Penicillium roqueforti]